MGIEPTWAPLPKQEKTVFAVAPSLKCDWRVNFCGTWGHVAIFATFRLAPDALGSREIDVRALPDLGRPGFTNTGTPVLW